MQINELYKPQIHPEVLKIAHNYYDAKSDWLNNSTPLTQNRSLDKKLKQLRWTKLGSGAYSSVYQNPKKNYVMKINNESDPGYDGFVRFIHHKRNIHFPKISDRRKFEIGGYPYYVYLIEKLTPLPKKIAKQFGIYLFMIAYAAKDNKSISNKKLLDIIINNGEPERKRAEYEDFFAKYPTLVNVAKLLGYKSNYMIDIHAGNIMQREDGTIVIIDPYVE